jgi:hypothetical protein
MGFWRQILKPPQGGFSCFWGIAYMYICYIDEAGCIGTMPHAYSSIQPVFVICGTIIDQKHIINFTRDFLLLKQKYFPNMCSGMHYLDVIKQEIKGSELRKFIKKSHNQRRFAFRFIDDCVKLLENYNVAILGRVSIKPIAIKFDGKAVYTSSIQHICSGFQDFLINKNDSGILIADSRDKGGNALVSHSIFTQKYKASGDAYDRILEMPVYGHSDNHAGIQITDLVSSSIVFPIATTVYCSDHIKNSTHYHSQFLNIRNLFGKRLSKLQYRYCNAIGHWHGGIKVSDPLGYQNATRLFYS